MNLNKWARRLWEFINKPVGLSLLTLGLIQWIAHMYVRQEQYLKDRADRANLLGPLLVEIAQRESELAAIDTDWRANLPAIRKLALPETDVVLGTGSYVATAPQFQRVHLVNLMYQVDYNANTFDAKLDYIGMFGLFSPQGGLISPIVVHTFIPQLQKYTLGRSMLLQSNQIPLETGRPLNKIQKAFLGDPFLRWADAKTAKRIGQEEFEQVMKDTRKLDEDAKDHVIKKK
jgi:hypothetical protein